MHYRIIKKDDWYIGQSRFLWIFWRYVNQRTQLHDIELSMNEHAKRTKEPKFIVIKQWKE